MIHSADMSGKFALDVKDLGALRESAKQNSPEALKATAKQFEALFMNMVMKSMREATPQEGLFDSQQSKMYTSMLDQQLSQTLASRGVGLAEVLVRQLSNNRGVNTLPDDAAASMTDDPATGGKIDASRLAQIAAFQEQMRLQNASGDPMTDLSATLNTRVGEAGAAAASEFKSRSSRPHVREFEERLMPHAIEASRTTGIPPKFMLGQAALESGWGKHEIRMKDGSPSHNLFGIKAGPGWQGKTVDTVTTEYVNGVPQKRVEKFRAYDSYADGFRDYARLLTTNPRYENVIANAQDAAGFARGLQRAGYATDPNYAAKLSKIINQTLST